MPKVKVYYIHIYTLFLYVLKFYYKSRKTKWIKYSTLEVGKRTKGNHKINEKEEYNDDNDRINETEHNTKNNKQEILT